MTERQRISQQWNSSEVTRIAGELLSTSKNGGAGERNGDEMTGQAAEVHGAEKRRKSQVLCSRGRARRYVEQLWRSGEENSKGVAEPRVEMEKLSRESKGSEQRRKS